MKNGASKLKNHLDQDSWLGHNWHSKFAFTTLESPQCRAWTASTKIIPRPLTWRKGGKNKKIVRCIFAIFADQNHFSQMHSYYPHACVRMWMSVYSATQTILVSASSIHKIRASLLSSKFLCVVVTHIQREMLRNYPEDTS